MSENSEQKKVLILDDDAFLLDMYITKFKGEGYDVAAFGDVDSALDYLRGGGGVDIIMLDLLMSGKTGWNMLEAMKEESLSRDSVVIVLTNQSEDQDITRANSYEVDGYIIKAVTIPSEVVSKVEEIYNVAQQ